MVKLLRIGLAGLVLILSVFNIITGIMGLTNFKKAPLSADAPKGSVCEFNVLGATPVMNIKHKLKSILPVGTEHYYAVIDDKNDVSPLLVRASESWYSKNFDSKGVAKKSLTVKGEVYGYKGASSQKVIEINREMEPGGPDTFSVEYYIDLQYIPRNTVKLLSGVLILAGVAALIFFFRRFGGDLSYTPAKVAYISSGVVGTAGLVLFAISITVLR